MARASFATLFSLLEPGGRFLSGLRLALENHRCITSPARAADTLGNLDAYAHDLWPRIAGADALTDEGFIVDVRQGLRLQEVNGAEDTVDTSRFARGPD